MAAEPDEALRRLRGVDLNLFVIFATVMQERNVTKTARRLLMSQAAVSAALMRLRRIFDDELFVRAPGGVAPTLVALRLQEPIQRALADLHIAVAGDAGFDPDTASAVFRLGMSDDVEAFVLPDLIAALADTSPRSALRCIQANRRTITELLDEGRVQIGVVASDRWGPEFRSRVLFESGYATAYSPSMLNVTGPLSKAQYLALQHVMIAADGDRGIVDDVLEAEGLSRTRVVSTAHFAMVPLLLSRIAAIATMPRHVAQVFADQFGLEVYEPPFDLPKFTISALWHQSSGADPALTWMINTITDVARDVARSALP